MDLDFSPEDNAFREEVRAFIAENYPAELRAKQASEDALSKEDYLSWHRILAKKGWVAPSLAGGVGRHRLDARPRSTSGREEQAARRHHRRSCRSASPWSAPVIYTFGTAGAEGALPAAASATARSGGARAIPSRAPAPTSPRLKTKAERITADDGKEYYIVNGQKTWTTLAQYADWGFFLVRTDPDAKPQAGISFLLIDMKSPGRHRAPDHHPRGRARGQRRLPRQREGAGREPHLPREPGLDLRQGPAGPRALRHRRRRALQARPRAAARRSPRTEPADDGGAAARRPVLQAQGRRAGDRPDGAGVHRAAHPGRREHAARGPGRKARSSRSRAPRSSSACTELALEAAGHYGAPYLRDFAAQPRPDRPRLRRRRRRRPTSTAARPRSTAAPTRSSATSSPRWCWGSDARARSRRGASTRSFDASTTPERTRHDRWTSASPKNSRCCATRSPAICATHYDFDKRRGDASSPRPAGGRRSGRPSPRSSASSARRSPEELGGLGGGPTENMMVMEEFGKALVVEPYLGTVVIGGGFLQALRPRRRRRADRQDHRRRGDLSPSPTPSRRAATTWPT